MHKCKKYHELIKKLISSDLNENEKSVLSEHVNKCKECSELLSIHENVESNQKNIPIPTPDEFRAMRQDTLRQIRLSESSKLDAIFDNIKKLFVRVEFAYGLALLFLIFTAYTFYSSEKTQGKIPSDLIEQIDYSAQQNQTLSDIENSPYTYSNIEIKEIDKQQIHLGFNVSTYIELIRDKNDPLVKEILAQSIINSPQTGAKLSTIAYAEELIDPKLKETLLFVVQNDPDLAVRLKALKILTKYANDDQIQDAFLLLLKNEESVQMRLIALDYLTSNKIDTSLIVKELNKATTRNNRPVLIEAQKYIKNLNSNLSN
jgi:hypothetical protein